MQSKWAICVAALLVLGSVAVSFPLAAQKATSATPSGAEFANRILDFAIHQLQQRGNLDAKFHFTADCFGKKLQGHGIYQEEKSQYPHCSLRYEITFQLPGGQTSRSVVLLDVANQSLWMNERPVDFGSFLAPPDPDVSFYCVNLERVRRSPKIGTSQGAIYGPPWYGQKSLENILKGFQTHFQFNGVWETTLPPLQASQAERIPVYYLRGEWKPEVLDQILEGRSTFYGESRSNKESGKRIPEEMPMEVRIYFDKQMFPLQMEYLRENETGERIPMLRVMFYDIHYNVRFVPHQFEFTPPQFSSAKDVTDEFLNTIP